MTTKDQTMGLNRSSICSKTCEGSRRREWPTPSIARLRWSRIYHWWGLQRVARELGLALQDGPPKICACVRGIRSASQVMIEEGFFSTSLPWLGGVEVKWWSTYSCFMCDQNSHWHHLSRMRFLMIDFSAMPVLVDSSTQLSREIKLSVVRWFQ